MKVSTNVDVTASALRVYLIHTLQQTEDLLAEGRLRAEVDSSLSPHYSTKEAWKHVINAALRATTFIKNCQHDVDLYGFSVRRCHGLCAIDAAQDDLRDALERARNSAGRHREAIEPLSGAKFVSNAIVASNMKDHELSSMWIEAAKFVKRSRDQLQHHKKVRSTVQKYLLAAVAIDADTKHSSVPEVQELRQLTARSYRRAAATAVYGGNKSHRSVRAAEAYEKAAQLCAQALEQGTTESAPLWSRAVATMRRGADLIVASEADESRIGTTITTALRLASDAQNVPALVTKMQTYRCAAEDAAREAVIARRPDMAAMWNVIKTELEKECDRQTLYLRFVLEGERKSSAAVELNAGMQTSKVFEVTQELYGLLRNKEYCEKKAAQSGVIPHAELRELTRKCWMLAATHIQNAIQTYCDGIVDAGFPLKTPVVDKKRLYIKATNFAVHTAEGTLHRAASHLSSACGAEKAGRDPREAQFWRSASECLRQAAKFSCSTIQNHIARLNNDTWYQGFDSQEVLDKERSYVSLAGYMHRAHLHRTAPDVEHSTRIASLYELVAGIVSSALARGPEFVHFHRIVPIARKMLLGYIAKLGSDEPLSEVEKLLWERGCNFASEYHSSANNAWGSALSSIESALDALLNTHDQAKADIWSAHAAIGALAAQASVQKDAERFFICDFAAHEMLQLFLTPNGNLIPYKVALAARLISLDCNNEPTHPVPEELLKIVNGPAVAGFQSEIESHARTFCLRAMCQRRSTAVAMDDTERILWNSAEMQVVELANLYDSQAKVLIGEHPIPFLASLLHAQEVAVECYIGAAKSVNNPKWAAVWDKAMAMCEVTALLPQSDVAKRTENVKAIERMIAAAKTRQK